MKALVFDTETIDLRDNRCFEIGWCIVDLKTGEKSHAKSFLVEGMFDSEAYKKAYYFEKNDPIYRKKLEAWEIEIKSFWDIRFELNNDFINNDIKVIAAFNIEFDEKAINKTIDWAASQTDVDPKLTKHFNLVKLSSKYTIIDIPILFAINRCHKEYIDFCVDNELITEKGNVRTNVEAMSKYIKGLDYSEEHTAKEDSCDEADLLYEAWKFGEDKDYTTKDKAWRIIKKRR